MASIYIRYRTWWIKFQHPATKRIIRANLETHDHARAKLLRRRIELEVALQEPRLQAAETPAVIRGALGLCPPTVLPSVELPVTLSETSPAPANPQRSQLNEAIKAYLDFIRAENAAHHVAGKISMLRRFFGSQRVSALLPPLMNSRPPRANAPNHPAFFRGDFLNDIRSSTVLEFLQQLPVSKKTKRHYRELFHHFFEFCLKLGLYQPANSHCPNPIGALPSFVSKNRHITFLTQPQIDEQLHVLRNDPKMQIGVALMIYAGLRRAETIWLTRESLASDGSYLSILNRVDHERDLESSLKTGERTVTILPVLRGMLQSYCSATDGRWLVPSSKGLSWSGDAFANKLRSLNAASGLKWTCLHFRHTYATQRATEGWSLFRIAKEMGNSVAVVEQYYAGYIRPGDSTQTHNEPSPSSVLTPSGSSESLSR